MTLSYSAMIKHKKQMAYSLEDIMAAFLLEFKSLDSITLTRLVYLLDIEHIKLHGEQATDIQWERNAYGPCIGQTSNNKTKGDNNEQLEQT